MELLWFLCLVAFFYAIFNGLTFFNSLILVGIAMVLLYVALFVLTLLAIPVLVFVKGLKDWLGKK